MLDMSEQQTKNLESMLREYLWNGRKPKISLDTLKKKKHQGGLQLVDIKAKQDALKIAWIFRIEDDVFLEKCVYSQLDTELDKLIWYCNLTQKDIKGLFETNSFWGQVLLAWGRLNRHKPQNGKEVLKQFIWYNSNVRIKNKPVLWKHWIDKNILFVKDIMEVDGNFKNSPIKG